MFATNSKSSFAHSAFVLKLTTMNLSNFIEPPCAFYELTNVYNDAQWQQKRSWINRYINQHQPDVIAFQEVFSVDVLKALLEPLGYRFFSAIDEPQIITNNIYKSPVVCLASRYPILSALPLQADPKLSNKLGISKNFAYSRIPLFATLELPSLGPCDFYVVHLKSKRPITDFDDLNNIESLHDSMQAEIIGAWASSIQRGSEASQLMRAIIERRSKTNNPAIIMGDFNDELDEEVLRAFHISRLRSITEDMAEIPLSHYQFHDCWELFLKNTEEVRERPSTHYFHGKGFVIDYILLSNEFNSQDPVNLAEVIDFHCEDLHLKETKNNNEIEGSDHAIVSVTISLRK